MTNYEARKRQWPNMAGLIQQANADHDALKSMISSLKVASEVEANVSSLFPYEVYGHKIKFGSIYPEISYIMVKKCQLEKDIYAYQVIWHPKKKEAADKEACIPFSTRANEVIYLTKNNASVSLMSLKAEADALAYNEQSLLLSKDKSVKEDVVISSSDINFKLGNPGRGGYTYNENLHMHNPMIIFNQLLCSEEEGKSFISKRIQLAASRSASSKYDAVAQLNENSNTCYILPPDSSDHMSQAKIERWVAANAIDSSEYPRLMEMFGYYKSSNEAMKLVKSIRR